MAGSASAGVTPEVHTWGIHPLGDCPNVPATLGVEGSDSVLWMPFPMRADMACMTPPKSCPATEILSDVREDWRRMGSLLNDRFHCRLLLPTDLC